MKKKVIKNTFLILLIPIVITIIVYFIFSRRLDNVFYDPINYETNNNTVISDNYNGSIVRMNSNDLVSYYSFLNHYTKNYNAYMVFAFVLMLIFSLIYSYVIKKKKW